MPIARRRDLYVLAVIAVMMLVVPWPFELPRRWAAISIGSIAYRLSRRKRQRSEEGVEDVFRGVVTTRQRRAIVKGAFRQYWQEPFVSPCSSGRSKDVVVGLSHVHKALAQGRGVILWESSEFGGRMAAKRILHDAGFRICQVHASTHLGGFSTLGLSASLLRQKVIEPFFDRHELRFVAEIISLPRLENVTGRRTLLQRLRENRIVCMANDGKYGQKFVSVPFFDRTRRVATGVTTLASASGATILPMFCVEESDGARRVVIEPPIRSEQAADRDRAAHDVAAQYVKYLESYMRRYPAQYRTWYLLRPRPALPAKLPIESRA
jgi:KDO2-lipid IV(A) lauroyltransferase